MATERAREIPVRFYRTDVGHWTRTRMFAWSRQGDRRVIGLDLMRVQFGWPIGMPLVRSLKDVCGKFAQRCRVSGLDD